MPAQSPTLSSPTDTIQLGRQPIFDRDLGVYAYELLYRDASGGSRITDGDQASSRTLLNAFMEIGIDRLIGRHKAFVNLTRQFFVDMPPIPFPPDRVVLEILEDVEVDAALIDGLGAMAEAGFALAMDDYAFQPQLAPLLPLVRYIKVEVPAQGLGELARRLPALKATGARLLAEKVETAAQFDQLNALGFDLFQGFFFARPNLVRSDRLREDAAVVMRLLARLNDPTLTMDEVVYLVSQDPSLSLKVLRYVNSAAVGLRSRVASIRHAVVLMGLARIRAWASLFVMARLDGRPSELFNLGLVRANLCEQLCRLSGRGAPDTAYTIGLLSILDAMLGRPIEELVAELPLTEETKTALAAHRGQYGALLAQAKRLEHGEQAELTWPGLTPATVNEVFAASSAAAFETLSSLIDD